MLVFRCGEGQHRGAIWYRNKTTTKAGLLCIMVILAWKCQAVNPRSKHAGEYAC